MFQTIQRTGTSHLFFRPRFDRRPPTASVERKADGGADSFRERVGGAMPTAKADGLNRAGCGDGLGGAITIWAITTLAVTL